MDTGLASWPRVVGPSRHRLRILVMVLLVACVYVISRPGLWTAPDVDPGPFLGAARTRPASRPATQWSRPRSRERQEDRHRMVDHLTGVHRPRVTDPAVIRAMRDVPRHWFVGPENQSRAYADRPLPIGHAQTISQPYMVAYMTQVLDLKPGDRVLEIGTGSAYQAAVLHEFTPNVYSIEIIKPLAKDAKKRLTARGYKHVKTKHADGYYGWKEHAPFDAIIVTCAAGHVPPDLYRQLKPGGRMCIPVKRGFGQVEDLRLVRKGPGGKPITKSLMGCQFVPMTGKVGGR